MEHLNQIQRAIDYIEDHLDQDLDVDQIARVAAFSRWHFQIVFSSAVGETLKVYIRKRRLAQSLLALKSEERILDIALSCGFESQESFSRAFKNQFGMTPGEFRKKDQYEFMILRKPKITMAYLNHLYEGVNMEPIIKEMSQFFVVGIAGRFVSILSKEKNNHIVIPKLWDHFLVQKDKIKLKSTDYDLGICLPLGPDEKNHPDECLYIAGTMVTQLTNIPEGMTGREIPHGTYAVFTHKGSLAQLDHTMNYIYGAWLPKSGKKLREAPDLELYDHRFNPESVQSEFDIYIPIL